MTGIDLSTFDRELKKGAAELLLLSLLDARARHGYERETWDAFVDAVRLVTGEEHA